MPDPQPPSQSPAQRPKRSLWQEIRRRLIITFVAFVLYVLSIGPLYWQYYNAKFNTGSALLAAFYEPLYLLCAYIPPLSRLVDAYIMLWID